MPGPQALDHHDRDSVDAPTADRATLSHQRQAYYSLFKAMAKLGDVGVRVFNIFVRSQVS
jgi:hypothetical protein